MFIRKPLEIKPEREFKFEDDPEDLPDYKKPQQVAKPGLKELLGPSKSKDKEMYTYAVQKGFDTKEALDAAMKDVAPVGEDALYAMRSNACACHCPLTLSTAASRR